MMYECLFEDGDFIYVRVIEDTYSYNKKIHIDEFNEWKKGKQEL